MNANFNSYSIGSACGAAFVNFTQQLADEERGLTVPSGEATMRKHCKILEAGNEKQASNEEQAGNEEPENIFVAYASNQIKENDLDQMDVTLKLCCSYKKPCKLHVIQGEGLILILRVLINVDKGPRWVNLAHLMVQHCDRL